MSNQIQMKAGDQFGRLTVLNPDIKRHQALCLCQCGNKKIVIRGNLKRGHTSSCGCFQKEPTAAAHYIHGKTDSRVFNSWRSMIQRCCNEKDVAFSKYGGRGVRVCDRWNSSKGGSFQNFLTDMGEPPTDEHTLDKDKLGNGMLYSPETCCWLDRSGQARHRRSNRMLTYNGQTKCVSEWAEAIGIKRDVIYDRLRRSWSVEKALSTPVKKRSD